MEEIIKKIIEFDEKEREILRQAYERKNHAEDVILKNRAEVNNRYHNETENKFKIIEKQLRDELPDELQGEDAVFRRLLNFLNEKHEKNMSLWVNEIFNLVIK